MAVSHFTRGYCQSNELLQLNHWAWSRLAQSDSLFVSAIIDDETGKSLEYRQLIQIDRYKKIRGRSYANELGRLAQGIRDIPGTNTTQFIHKDQVPKGRKVTYSRIVCTHRPQKFEPDRSRLTAGGDRLDFPGETATPTADLTTIKLLWNLVISTPRDRYIKMDVKTSTLTLPLLTSNT